MINRRMPQPWFRAQASNRVIYELMRGDSYRQPIPGERALGPFVLPTFQRGAVWTRDQQVRLIESIWSGLPIGAYVYNTTDLGNPCDGWLLDGQQRITAIFSYVVGDFPVFGWRFPDLPLTERRRFGMTPIAALQTNIADGATCREIYNRLAHGGTPHAAVAAMNDKKAAGPISGVGGISADRIGDPTQP